jgi:hypothetical protein
MNKLPNIFKNQLNSKTALENYIDSKEQIKKQMLVDADQLEAVLSKSLDDILIKFEKEI